MPPSISHRSYAVQLLAKVTFTKMWPNLPSSPGIGDIALLPRDKLVCAPLGSRLLPSTFKSIGKCQMTTLLMYVVICVVVRSFSTNHDIPITYPWHTHDIPNFATHPFVLTKVRLGATGSYGGLSFLPLRGTELPESDRETDNHEGLHLKKVGLFVIW